MGATAATKQAYHRVSDRIAAFVANDDPFAAAANTGSFLVWSSQPLYPLYVWLLVGDAAWPSLLTWLSTPFFIGVALVARRHPLGGRVLFVVAGVLNTLLSTKAFGTNTSVGWFLVPCLVIAAGYFRTREWIVAVALCAMVGLAAALVPHLGAPLHSYDTAQATSLSHLNIWSVIVLSIYLAYAAIRAHRRSGRDAEQA